MKNSRVVPYLFIALALFGIGAILIYWGSLKTTYRGFKYILYGLGFIGIGIIIFSRLFTHKGCPNCEKEIPKNVDECPFCHETINK